MKKINQWLINEGEENLLWYLGISFITYKVVNQSIDQFYIKAIWIWATGKVSSFMQSKRDGAIKHI